MTHARLGFARGGHPGAAPPPGAFPTHPAADGSSTSRKVRGSSLRTPPRGPGGEGSLRDSSGMHSSVPIARETGFGHSPIVVDTLLPKAFLSPRGWGRLEAAQTHSSAATARESFPLRRFLGRTARAKTE